MDGGTRDRRIKRVADAMFYGGIAVAVVNAVQVVRELAWIARCDAAGGWFCFTFWPFAAVAAIIGLVAVGVGAKGAVNAVHVAEDEGRARAFVRRAWTVAVALAAMALVPATHQCTGADCVGRPLWVALVAWVAGVTVAVLAWRARAQPPRAL